MVKNPPADAGGLGMNPGLGRTSREGNDNAFQYSCLANSMDGGTRWATVHGVTKSDTTEQWSTHVHTHSVNLNFNTFIYKF